MFDTEDNTFLLAGPVKMHPRVLRAAGRQAVAHRSPEFTEVNRDLERLLKEVFQTTDDVAVLAGSGTIGMDAAAQSLLQEGDAAVAIDNGKFGNRFATLARKYGDATVVETPWGEAPTLDAVDAALEEAEPKAVFLTHNESSTAVTNPLREIAELAHDHGALVVADCITSIGGMDVPVDDWGVDVAIVGSQKCLGAPAGLAFVSASDAAQEAMDPDAGYYLNLRKHLDRMRTGGQTPFTPAIPLHLAAREALRVATEEGLVERFDRVSRQARAVRAAVEAMGLELFPDLAFASDTVTAVRYPEGVSDGDVRGKLKEEHGVVIAGGQGPVKGDIFRVGHLGTATFAELAAGLQALETVLVDLGAPVRTGAWSGAFRKEQRG